MAALPRLHVAQGAHDGVTSRTTARLRRELRAGWRLACLAIVVVAVAAWSARLWTSYRTSGLFHWIGADFRIYFAHSVALRSGDLTALYDLQALKAYHAYLAPYTSEPLQALRSGHVLYPPVFAWLFVPFTVPPPPVGFALWTGLNVLAACYLAWRVSTLFPERARPWAGLLLLTSFPLVQALVLGQPVSLLACAAAECYRSLRDGRDFRAGLWLACLLFKPQYAILLGVLLIWKRRRRAVAGVALGGAAIAGGSLIVVGGPALLGYPSALLEEGDFRGTRSPSFPEEMINWRSLILYFLPQIADGPGTGLALAMGLLTVGCVALAWRGPWAADDPRFASRISLVFVGTLLASYHSHLHGAVLLAVPLAAALAEGRHHGVTTAAIASIVVLPSLMLARTFLPLGTLPIPPLFALVLVICAASLLIELWLPAPPVRHLGTKLGGHERSEPSASTGRTAPS